MNNISQKIIPILKKYGVKKAALFGSYARGEENEKSDIDLLIDLKQVPSYFELARLQIQLEETLGKKVDLVMEQNIKTVLIPYIQKDLISIYEEN